MFREAIGQFVPEPRATLYVPKNKGLNEYVNSLLREIGVRDTREFDRADRSKGILDIVAARGEDVPQRVDDCIQRGEVAYGLTGDDLFDEYVLEANNSPLEVLNTYDWFDPSAQFNRPALCLLNREGLIPESSPPVSIAVNRKYERSSCQYLSQRLQSRRIQFSVVAYAGDTENTVVEGTHDWCVEVVYRGDKSPDSAVSRAGLKVAEVVRFSDISLIGRKITNPWEEEYRRIVAVAQNPTGSSTSKLLGDKNEICKKVGEESAEFVRAFTQETGIPAEYNDVVYALMVGAAKLQVPWPKVEADLKSRWKSPACL